MNIPPPLLGIIRGLGTAVIVCVLAYFGDAAHLNGIVSDALASVIAAIALAIEHHIEAGGGGALFGSVNRS